MAVYSVKHSSKKPFLEETREEFEGSLEEYVGGAFTFAQESVKRFFADHGEEALAEGGGMKGVGAFIPERDDTNLTLDRRSFLLVHSVHYDAARNLLRTVPVALRFDSWRRHLRASSARRACMLCIRSLTAASKTRTARIRGSGRR